MLRNTKLAKAMHNEQPDYWQYEYEDFLETFCLTIIKLIKQGESIQLENFGTFKPKLNKVKHMSHPQTQERITTEASITMQFTVSRALMDKLKQEINVADFEFKE